MYIGRWSILKNIKRRPRHIRENIYKWRHSSSFTNVYTQNVSYFLLKALLFLRAHTCMRVCVCVWDRSACCEVATATIKGDEKSFSLIKDEDKCAVNTCTRLNALFESTHPHKEHNEMHTVYVILCNAHVPRQIPKHARCLVGWQLRNTLDQSLTADVNASIHISHWDLKNGLVVILFFKLSTGTFTRGVWWTKGRRARALTKCGRAANMDLGNLTICLTAVCPFSFYLFYHFSVLSPALSLPAIYFPGLSPTHRLHCVALETRKSLLCSPQISQQWGSLNV